jgi:hypothetical protein
MVGKDANGAGERLLPYLSDEPVLAMVQREEDCRTLLRLWQNAKHYV